MTNNKKAMKHYFIAGIALLMSWSTVAQEYKITSPDGQQALEIDVKDEIVFSLSHEGKVVIASARVGMDLSKGKDWTAKQTLKSGKETEGLIEKTYAVPNKEKISEDAYRGVDLSFETFDLQFRLFDDGLAYRFVGRQRGEIEVLSEQLDIEWPAATSSFFPEEKSMYSHFEQSFVDQPLDSIQMGAFCAMPVRFDSPEGVGVLITEADLDDYPCLFLEKQEGNTFVAKFPKYVLEIEPLASRPDRNEVIKKEAEYIAKTSGKRNFPWRVFITSDEDKDFVASNLVMQLSPASEIKDESWIKPGKIAWDWYNANNVYGVDFQSGINNETYKYYIDFAAEYGLEYVILDEGWTKTTTNVYESTEDIDIPELVAYGKEKGVDLILWLLWHPLDKDIEGILSLYSSWGVKGIKVDFMQRPDQYMVNSYEKIAKVAGDNKLLVDFHGAFKPAGLRSRYPNVMTYEGVLGNENNKWSKHITPEHNVTIPFTRMVAGPMDFTPGVMANAQPKNYHISFDRPMSIGTRAHQVAMYVVFESPLQMLCDAPSAYLKEKETTEFISQIPSVWDETVVLEGEIGDYLVIARRKGDSWYVAAMTDENSREFDINLDFLKEGKFAAQIYTDGVNAEKFAEDYTISTKKALTSKDNLKAKLASGGGWAVILSPEQ